jgi:hypothetical protein
MGTDRPIPASVNVLWNDPSVFEARDLQRLQRSVKELVYWGWIVAGKVHHGEVGAVVTDNVTCRGTMDFGRVNGGGPFRSQVEWGQLVTESSQRQGEFRTSIDRIFFCWNPYWQTRSDLRNHRVGGLLLFTR